MTPHSAGEPRSASGRTVTPRAAFWCALSIWVLTLAVAAAALVYNHVHPLPLKLSCGTGSAAIDTVAVAFIVGFATVGALLGWKRPANPIGWLLSATGLSYAFGAAGLLLLQFPRTRPWGHWLGWLYFFGIGFVVFVLLLFPTGSLPSRRWRPVAWAAAAGIAAWVFGNAFAPHAHLRGFPAGAQPGRRGRAGRARLRRAGRSRRSSDRGDWPGRHRVAGVPLPAGPDGGARAAEMARLRRRAHRGGGAGSGTDREDPGAERGVHQPPERHQQRAGRPGPGRDRYRHLPLPPLRHRRRHQQDPRLRIARRLHHRCLRGDRRRRRVPGARRATQPRAVDRRDGGGGSRLPAGTERVQRLANRLVYGQRAIPYEVLADFAGRMAGAYAAEDLLPRMASILAEGTAATRADVWLKSGEVFHDGAAWPPDAP